MIESPTSSSVAPQTVGSSTNSKACLADESNSGCACDLTDVSSTLSLAVFLSRLAWKGITLFVLVFASLIFFFLKEGYFSSWISCSFSECSDSDSLVAAVS